MKTCSLITIPPSIVNQLLRLLADKVEQSIIFVKYPNQSFKKFKILQNSRNKEMFERI